MNTSRGFISFYLIASVILMSASLLGGLYLIKVNQDNRNIATSTCLDSTRIACDKAITDNNWEKCTTIGKKECRWFNGAYVTYLCKASSPYCENCSIGVWVISNFLSCEVGGVTGAPLPDNCGWNGSTWTKIPLGGECYAVRYHCPDMTSSLASSGCNPTVYGGKETGPAYKVFRTSADGPVTYDSSYCGVQQLDAVAACNCDIKYHSIYYPCTTPTTQALFFPSPTPTKKPTSTPTRIPTNTPTATKTPTPTLTPTGTRTPTLTPTLTSTPTLTLTPTLTPTGTQMPTQTPTSTRIPTNTPANTSTPRPTEIIVYTTQASPTRIILPQSGVDFPFQFLTILGAIVTLAGFLILL